MEIVNLRAVDISKYKNNARTHSPEQIAQLEASILKYGFNNPLLLDKDHELIAGHGRIEALCNLIVKDLFPDSIPCIILGHLTPEQKKAYVIADNKIAMNSGWDYEMLRDELLSIKEFDTLDDDLMSGLGFEDYELNSLLGIEGENSSPENIERGNIDGGYAEGEWNGMPEFNQGNKESFRHVIIHFKNQEDAADFFAKIDHPFTDKTKSLWHPRQINMDTEAKRY